MLYYSKVSSQSGISHNELNDALIEIYQKLGNRKKVLAIPPDITRFYSQAGILTQFTY